MLIEAVFFKFFKKKRKKEKNLENGILIWNFNQDLLGVGNKPGKVFFFSYFTGGNIIYEFHNTQLSDNDIPQK